MPNNLTKIMFAALAAPVLLAPAAKADSAAKKAENSLVLEWLDDGNGKIILSRNLFIDERYMPPGYAEFKGEDAKAKAAGVFSDFKHQGIETLVNDRKLPAFCVYMQMPSRYYLVATVGANAFSRARRLMKNYIGVMGGGPIKGVPFECGKNVPKTFVLGLTPQG